MKSLKNHYDNFCLGLGPRTQAGLLISGPVVILASVVLSFFIPGSSLNLFEFLGFAAALPPMLTGSHAVALHARAREIAFQNRDVNKWAVELVNKEPTVDVLQLQKALDLREMQIDCQELDDRVWDVVDEDLTHPELEALQRAVNQRAAKEMNGW